MIGRVVDVPNGLWAGCDDGGYTAGTVVKAGRTRGVVDFQLRFGAQDGLYTAPTWLRLDQVFGQAPIDGTELFCRLHKAAPARTKASRAMYG